MDNINLAMAGFSTPESDMRSTSHPQQPHLHLDTSQALYPSGNYMYCGEQGLAQQNYGHGFVNQQTFPAPTPDPNFSNLTDQEIADALASFQPCDDCTPATKTAIPHHHHHHPSGRLAGASATLDGHFCCSWLVNGQPCFLCFQSAEALDNHIKSDHAGKDGTYRCLWHECSKIDTSTNIPGAMNFGNKPKLMRHIHSHTGHKPFACPYPGCDKGFVTKEQLKNHETTHTKSRKYQCQLCNKAFAVKSALTTHITAVHDEKKTHCCDLCGKAFADSSNLSKHKQTHYRQSVNGGVRKSRSRRGTSTTSTTARSTPSIQTPTIDPLTPSFAYHNFQDFSFPPISPGLGMMAPPPPSLTPTSSAFCSMAPSSTYSTVSSPPPPTDFDPDCYCCDQSCPPPPGPASPCNHDLDDCNLGGFCDLEECGVDECDVTACTDAGCEAPPCEGDMCDEDPSEQKEQSHHAHAPWADLMTG